MVNVLVTGGSGFIASNLVDRLIALNYFVVNIDKLDYCSFKNTTSIPGKYKFIQGDINSKELINFIFKEYNIEVVFHLAAQTHVDNSFFNSTQFTYDNICGTHNLLECMKLYNTESKTGGIQKFIHMSTDEVYGQILEGEEECTETSVLKPTNPYSATKAGAELLAASYYHSFKLPIVIIRCNNVFGPRQYPEKVIPAFIFNLMNNKKCKVHGNGNTERHFIYVENVVDAIMTIYEKGELNEIYNIASTECYKVIDLVKLLVKKLKNDDNFEQYMENVSDRKFNDFRYLINSNKLEKLGWKPTIAFEEGIENTIRFFEENMHIYNKTK